MNAAISRLDTAGYDAANAARWFHNFGLDLSDDATYWAERLGDLKANPPQPPAPNATAHLIADKASEAAIAKSIAAHLAQQYRASQHAQACNIAGQKVLNAIYDDRDRLHQELASHAEGLIDRLHQAAAIDESVTDLTRRRATDLAHLVATADSDCEDLRQLIYARDTYLTRKSLQQWVVGIWDCRVFKNPWAVVGHVVGHDGSNWSRWRAHVKSGARLWYPTFEEATEAAASHTRKPSTTPDDMSSLAAEVVTPTPQLRGHAFTG